MSRSFTVQCGGEAYVFVDPRGEIEKQLKTSSWKEVNPLVADTVVHAIARESDGLTTLRRLMRWFCGSFPNPNMTTTRVASYIIKLIDSQDVKVLRWAPARVPALVQQPPKMEPPPKPAPEPQRECDWKLECQHHKKGKRPYGKYKVLQVVPEKGEGGRWVDVVKVHYKEKPDRDVVLMSGQAALAKKNPEGGYKVFQLETEVPDDNSLTNFFVPRFWDMLMKPQVHEISGGAEPFRVEVFNPHTYKFEFGLPPFSSSKGGSKFEKGKFWQGEGKDRQMVSRGKTETWSEKRTGWSRSKLGVVSMSVSGSDFEPDKVNNKRDATSGTCSFYRDGSKVELDVLKSVSQLLKILKSLEGIVNAIKENAPPRVGWYFDSELQVMQGKLAVEWGWREFEDHTAFHSIDFNIQLTIFKSVLEVGVGVQGLGFKAQVFFQLSGALSVSADGRIEDPRAAVGVSIPASLTMAAAIGARVEAGNLLKAEARGDSGLKIEAMIGINRLDRRRDPQHASLFNFDFVISWTGLKVSATVSGGLFGIGRARTWERVLVQPAELFKGRWPEPTKFEAPDLSRDRIVPLMLEKITDGWNLQVYRRMDEITPAAPSGVSIPQSGDYWTPAQVAEALATAIVNHTTCSRTPELIKALGVAVRTDLDLLAERDWRRDYVSERDFIQYLRERVVTDGKNRFRSVGLQARLDEMIDPGQKMAQQLQKQRA
jgi:hypothetical protein